MLSESPFTFDRVVRIAIAVGVIWLLITLIAYLSDVLIPFAVALLLAYLINPLTSWLQRKLPFKQRIISVLLSLTIILAAVVLFLSILIPMVVSEVAQMQRLLSGLVDADQWQARLQDYVPEEIRIYIADLVRFEELVQLLNFENIRLFFQQILPGIWGVFSGTISFIIGLAVVIVILLYLVFILLDFDEISEGWKELIPDQYRQVVLDVVSDFTKAMRVYFRAQALIAFIVGLLFALGFWLIGLPMGILLGLFIGLLNMVPYLQVVGLIPAVLFAIAGALGAGESIWVMLVLVLAVFAVVQVIQDAILVPRIMGSATGF
ncbi:MAG: AI-2E family transporter, partial [Gemmatimonadetes bacterium]|nr:AI-2E family transporter [Gemmatimonadota bacterium]